MARKGQKFKKYSTELKAEVVRKYFEEYIPAKALGEEYGVPTNTVENWVYKAKQGKDVLTDHRQFGSGRPKKEEGDIDYKERYEILKNTKPSSRHNERKGDLYQYAYRGLFLGQYV